MKEIASAARQLADYATGLRFDTLPKPVVDLAWHCLIDAVACAIHGSRQPWSRILLESVLLSCGEGPCSLAGALPRGLPPVPAALCLGAFAHAFELDSLRKPGAGVHPGATVALPALAAAQATGASSHSLLAAIVAGCEVMFRIGDATLHSAEEAGFHAPGLTGPFGAATAAGRLFGLDVDQLTHAYGLCGSMGGGLLNFAQSRKGGMVKRLHLGRAAESGMLAAILAKQGFQGPPQILEGRFGLLDAFCPRSDAERLVVGLGTNFEIRKLCIKRYSCHVTAQAPVQLLRQLMVDHSFGGSDIVNLELCVSDKVLSHHSERQPDDLMLAQYSVPFSVALAAFRDPEDPASFAEDALGDLKIATLAKLITLTSEHQKGWSALMRVVLADGRMVQGSADYFSGCPEAPFEARDVMHKFARLTGEGVPDWLSRLVEC